MQIYIHVSVYTYKLQIYISCICSTVALSKWATPCFQNQSVGLTHTHTRTHKHTHTHMHALSTWAQPYVGTTIHLTSTHCNTLQHTATHYNTLQQPYIGNYDPSDCDTLRHTAPHCDLSQHTATADGLSHTSGTPSDCNTLRHTATHCTTLRLAATHCNSTWAQPYIGNYDGNKWLFNFFARFALPFLPVYIYTHIYKRKISNLKQMALFNFKN